MPVRNEGINLKNMLKILSVMVETQHEILVIYDSLSDDSIPVLEKIKNDYTNIRPIYNNLGEGIINALNVGIAEAKGDYLLLLSADDIGPVLAIGEMMDLLDNGCDLVSATRYAYGGRVYGGHFMGRLFSRTANKLFYFLGGKLTDSTVGIKMVKKNVLNQIKLTSKPVGWISAFELSIRAQLMNLTIGEIPIISINRFYGGKSSFKFFSWLIEYSKWFLWGIKELYFSKKISPVVLKVPDRFLVNRR